MMVWLKKHLAAMLLLLMTLAGAALMAYPSFSSWWNSLHQSEAIGGYIGAVTRMSDDSIDEQLAEAELYNKKIASGGIIWQPNAAEQSEYEAMLRTDRNEVMAVVEIPKLSVRLPVYHGTDATVLQSGLGHIAGSSMPVGGASTHAIISGHRGLPSSKLLTDLNKMVEGDLWTVTVYNRTITYQVDQIRVVEPADLSSLRIEEGKDLCTIFTCTPYGINTQRLLVRGHRVPNETKEQEILAEAIQIEPSHIIPFIAVPIFVFLIIVMLLHTRNQRLSKKAKQHAEQDFKR